MQEVVAFHKKKKHLLTHPEAHQKMFVTSYDRSYDILTCFLLFLISSPEFFLPAADQILIIFLPDILTRHSGVIRQFACCQFPCFLTGQCRYRIP